MPQGILSRRAQNCRHAGTAAVGAVTATQTAAPPLIAPALVAGVAQTLPASGQTAQTSSVAKTPTVVQLIAAAPVAVADTTINVDTATLTGSVDIVFLLDITGSMSGTINGCKANIQAFTEKLTENGVDWRAKVVGYQDITCDGDQWYIDAPFVNSAGNSADYTGYNAYWEYPTDSKPVRDTIAAQLACLSADGGGDWPESAFDALWKVINTETSAAGDAVDPLKWRPRTVAKRYVIILTDADTKPLSLAASIDTGDTDVSGTPSTASSLVAGTAAAAPVAAASDTETEADPNAPLVEKLNADGVGITAIVPQDYVYDSETGEYAYTYHSSYAALASVPTAKLVPVASINSLTTEEFGELLSEVADDVITATGEGKTLNALTGKGVKLSPPAEIVAFVKALPAKTKVTYVWLKDGDIINKMKNGELVSAKTFTAKEVGSYTLEVRYVTPSNETGAAKTESLNLGTLKEFNKLKIDSKTGFVATAWLKADGTAGKSLKEERSLTVVEGEKLKLKVTLNDDAVGPFYYTVFKNKKQFGERVESAAKTFEFTTDVFPAKADSYQVSVETVARIQKNCEDTEKPFLSVKSKALKPKVIVLPTVTITKAAQTVNDGKNVSIAAKAKGTAKLAYQWYLNGIEIPGATKATLSLKKVDSSDEGTYTVKVWNTAVGNDEGYYATADATLTVNAGSSSGSSSGSSTLSVNVPTATALATADDVAAGKFAPSKIGKDAVFTFTDEDGDVAYYGFGFNSDGTITAPWAAYWVGFFDAAKSAYSASGWGYTVSYVPSYSFTRIDDTHAKLVWNVKYRVTINTTVPRVGKISGTAEWNLKYTVDYTFTSATAGTATVTTSYGYTLTGDLAKYSDGTAADSDTDTWTGNFVLTTK